MHIINRTIKGGIGLFFVKVLNNGSQILFVILLTRFLGQYKYGLLAIGLAIITIITPISAFGLPNSSQIFFSGKSEKKTAKIFGSVLFVEFFITFLLSILLFFLSNLIATKIFQEPQLIIILRILSITLLIIIPSNLLKAILQAKERVKWRLAIEISESFTRIIAFLILILVTKSLYSALLAIIISSLLSFSLGIYFLRKINFKPELNLSFRDIKMIICFSFPFLITGMGYTLATSSDRLMLGILTAASLVAAYVVASKLVNLMYVVSSSFIEIFKPLTSQNYKEKNYKDINENYLFIAKWVSIVNGIILILFTFFGSKILIIFGKDFATKETYNVLLLLASFAFFTIWVGPTGALLQMTGRRNLEFFNAIIFIFLNIILNFYLIQTFGIIGAALATFISGVIKNLVQIFQIKFYYKFTPINKKHILLGALIIPVIIQILMPVSNNIIRYILFICMVLIIIVYLLISKNKNDLILFNFIRGLLHKVKIFK